MPISPNDPAFPSEVKELGTIAQAITPRGLTKREWFAGMAMQGLLSDNKNIWSAIEVGRKAAQHSDESISRLAVSYADALCKELSK